MHGALKEVIQYACYGVIFFNRAFCFSFLHSAVYIFCQIPSAIYFLLQSYFILFIYLAIHLTIHANCRSCVWLFCVLQKGLNPPSAFSISFKSWTPSSSWSNNSQDGFHLDINVLWKELQLISLLKETKPGILQRPHCIFIHLHVPEFSWIFKLFVSFLIIVNMTVRERCVLKGCDIVPDSVWCRVDAHCLDVIWSVTRPTNVLTLPPSPSLPVIPSSSENYGKE